MNKKSAGLMCLIAGGLVWPVGFMFEYELPQILPVHLVFIGSGLALRGSHLLQVIRNRRNS